jgi:hypothetical protein
MKRPAKKEFSDFICRPYCVFFREGQKEDMACGGALRVMELIESGLLSIELFPESSGVCGIPDGDPILFELICRSCPFVIDGCDFRLPTPPADAVACGGFALLAFLHNAGMITSDELRKIAHE